MPSPFPGMNPYLENPVVRLDFHLSIIYAIRVQLARKLTPAYLVRAETDIYIHELPDGDRRLDGRSDVAITSDRQTDRNSPALTLQPPACGTFPVVDLEKVHFIEVRDRDHGEVATTIEVLSSSNKKNGADRDQYLGKRERLIKAGVHLVEINLLRGGTRPPIEGLPSCDYLALTARHDLMPDVPPSGRFS